MTEIPELTNEQFTRAIPASVRKRLMLGHFDSGEDIAALRRFVGLTQVQFALAMSISVHTPPKLGARPAASGRSRDRPVAYRRPASADHP